MKLIYVDDTGGRRIQSERAEITARTTGGYVYRTPACSFAFDDTSAGRCRYWATVTASGTMEHHYTLRWLPNYYPEIFGEGSPAYTLFQTFVMREVLSGHTYSIYGGQVDQYFVSDEIGLDIPTLDYPEVTLGGTGEIPQDFTWGRGNIFANPPNWVGLSDPSIGIMNTVQGWYEDCVSYFFTNIVPFTTPFGGPFGGGIRDCVQNNYSDTRAVTFSNEIDYAELQSRAETESISDLISRAVEISLPIDYETRGYYEYTQRAVINGRFEKDLATYVRVFGYPIPWPTQMYFNKVDYRPGKVPVVTEDPYNEKEWGIRVACTDLRAVAEASGVSIEFVLQKRPNANGDYLPKTELDDVDPQAQTEDYIVQPVVQIVTKGSSTKKEKVRVKFGANATLREDLSATWGYGSGTATIFLDTNPEDQLNELTDIVSSGGVSVTSVPDSGGGLIWEIEFDEVGARSSFLVRTLTVVLEERTVTLETTGSAIDGEYFSAPYRLVSEPGTSWYITSVSGV